MAVVGRVDYTLGYLFQTTVVHSVSLIDLFCQISAFEEPIKHAPLVMLDGNITQEAIDHACSFCATNHIPGTKENNKHFKKH